MSIFMVISGTLCGLEEEAVAFYPIMCPIFIAMGYDAIVTMGLSFWLVLWALPCLSPTRSLWLLPLTRRGFPLLKACGGASAAVLWVRRS